MPLIYTSNMASSSTYRNNWPTCICMYVCIYVYEYARVFSLIVHPSINFLPLIRGQVVGSAAWAGTPRLLSPRTLPLAPPGGSQGIPRPAERHSHSSKSWVFLGFSSRWGMPGTPPEGGVQGASDIDARATSAGSSWCGGAAALLWAPPGWQSSSPYL